MMIGTAPVLTEVGKSMMIRGMLGEHIVFRGFQLGAGRRTNPETATSLANRKLNVGLKLAGDPENGFIRLTGTFNNDEVTSGFRWTEMGIMARGQLTAAFTGTGSAKTFTLSAKPEVVFGATVNGNAVTVSGYVPSTGVVTLAAAPASGAAVEIHYMDTADRLYAYCADTNGDDITPTSGAVSVEQTISVTVAIGQAENVTAMLTNDTLYAGKADFDAHVADKANPHGVTKAQLGLSKVVNAAPPEMVPGMDVPANMTLPAATDRMDALMGKAFLVAEALMNHLTANNPHNISADLLGLVVGNYIGDGKQKRLINLGFQPRAVIVADVRGCMYDDTMGYLGGIATREYGVASDNGNGSANWMNATKNWNSDRTVLMIANSGFYVNLNVDWANDARKVRSNINGHVYVYIALK